MQTTTLSLYRFGSIRDRLWVFGQMGAARWDMMRNRRCSFWKLCGSGTGEGFTPRPNTAVWAILTVWSDEETARNQLDTGAHARWGRRADERFDLLLSPISARGTWSGKAPFDPGPARPGPVAALTRATIRPKHLTKFWAAEPDISARIGTDPNVMMKIGIGEVPWLHQVTFSIWPDAASMRCFARETGPHAAAIRAVREGDWFAEELYTRFSVIGHAGTWGGTDPLASLAEAA